MRDFRFHDYAWVHSYGQLYTKTRRWRNSMKFLLKKGRAPRAAKARRSVSYAKPHYLKSMYYGRTSGPGTPTAITKTNPLSRITLLSRMKPYPNLAPGERGCDVTAAVNKRMIVAPIVSVTVVSRYRQQNPRGKMQIEKDKTSYLLWLIPKAFGHDRKTPFGPRTYVPQTTVINRARDVRKAR